MSQTIDVGIDLGTTNSAIALQEGAATRLLPDADGAVLTPSVVHVDANGVVTVGKAAASRLRDDPANTRREFKRLMGSSEPVVFPASGRMFRPPELAAEVLRHLRDRAAKSLAREIKAAVITVPAMFQLPQCEATMEAARLAGFEYAPLLQEPIAAAVAHAGTGHLGEGHWLIYDLGGGTFDVSLVRSRAGRLQIVDHDGDNHLGGKDWDRLVARRAAEIVRAAGRLGSFRVGDPECEMAYALLRTEAERVRLMLSIEERAEFHIDRLARAPDGEWVGVRFELSRTELKQAITPLIQRTIELCQRVLERNRLAPDAVKAVVLVGGPTLTPFLPEQLEQRLHVNTRQVLNPSWVVAEGAALFAATQMLPPELRSARQSTTPHTVDVDLTYDPMTNDLRPVLVGRLGEHTTGRYQIRVISHDHTFDSRQLECGNDGTFVATLELRPNQLNAFRLEITREGTVVPVEPSQFTIVHGTSLARPPLSESVGVMLSDNAVRWCIRKGRPLPAEATMSLATTVALRRGQSGDAVNVPLVQGENERADRNTVIGVLKIQAENILRDLPVGSEVQITLRVDEHSRTAAGAHVPFLNQAFDDVVRLGSVMRTADELRDDLDRQRKRVEELAALADSLDASDESAGPGPGATEIPEIEELLAEGDTDALDCASRRLHELTECNDRTEKTGRKNQLMQRFFGCLDIGLAALKEQPDEHQRSSDLKTLTAEFMAALADDDFDLAESRLSMAHDIVLNVLCRHFAYWQDLFEVLRKRVSECGGGAEFVTVIQAGVTAVRTRDKDKLIETCLQLLKMLSGGAADLRGTVFDVVSHVKTV